MRRPLARLRLAAGFFLFITLYAIPSTAQLDVRQRVLASGGTPMSSTNFGVRGTVGQPGNGVVNSTNFGAVTGYWFLPGTVPTAIGDTPDVPRTFSLDQNYPNPFNPTTTIRFALPRQSIVSLRVFDVSGKLVSELVNETRPAGIYNEVYDASSLASGIYFYRIQTDGFVQTRKLVLMK